MKRVLVFGGTTEGRRLSERLSACGVNHTVCVATGYGEDVLAKNVFLEVRVGRLNAAEMRTLMQEGGYSAVVDATHPYADEVTDNVRKAVCDLDIQYFRLVRDVVDGKEYGVSERCFDTNEECARALEGVQGNILLTTGSKELGIYCKSEDVRNRLFVRVIPSVESIGLCASHGIMGSHVIAMQGPFSEEMNEAIMRQYDIACLVTKKSGSTGGYGEKLKAASAVGVKVFVVSHKGSDEGFTFSQVCSGLGL